MQLGGRTSARYKQTAFLKHTNTHTLLDDELARLEQCVPPPAPLTIINKIQGKWTVDRRSFQRLPFAPA